MENLMRGFGRSLRDAWRLALPYFVSEERWSARGLLAVVLGMRLILVGMSVLYSFWNRAFFNALQDKDWDSFMALLFTYKTTPTGILPSFVVISALFVLIAIYRTYLNQFLSIRWRRWMSERLMADWLGGQAYWRIGLAAGSSGAHGTDNPDQRIAEDVRDFVDDSLTLSVGLISAVVSLFSFVTILWSLSGALTVWGVNIPGYMVWVAVAYAVVGTVFTHLVGRKLVPLKFRQQKVEADFRFALARIRENLEGIVLSRGEAREKAALSARFAALIGNFRQIMSRTKQLTTLTASYDQASQVFPIVVAAPRYFAGQIPLGALTQTSSAFGQVENALSWFVHAYASLASWRATIDRLAAFQGAIHRAQALPSELHAHAGDHVGLHDVTVRLPDGSVLLAQADLSLVPGRSVVLTGRSGAGKSTLFRTIAGVWPYGSGSVIQPDGMMFLPQRPYLPLGTLREAIAYPQPPDAYADTALRETLDAVGLGHLAGRLDEDEPWAQRLSGGEQQRVAIARALLARPAWLFLDEATASLDGEAEAELYALLRTRLPDTTLVSIAHRASVAALHERELILRGGKLLWA
jgi:putative ATP-binding cassette transporter